mgnify:CR=1 FL=1
MMVMTISDSPPKRRGRPPKARISDEDSRALLLRAGLEILTEKGFSASGLDEILKRVGVPKGSFYHYFDSKEAFGLALIEEYGRYFAAKLERHFSNQALPPLARIQAFADDAEQGMARFEWRRGCLIGNLGQEVAALPASFRSLLQDTFGDWQQRLAICLEQAVAAGELARHADCQALASWFWTGWEGAVLQARLQESSVPLQQFVSLYLQALPRQTLHA